QLSASTFGQGNAGNVTVSAKNAVDLAGNSYILSTVEPGGVGKGGNIDINAANLSLTDGAQLLTITREASATRPAGRGDAGNVNVKVTGAVDIAGEKNGFPSQITSSVDTGTVGNGGNIFIDSGSFSLGDGAKLSASTFGQGNAGNVTVSAKNAVDLADAAILSTVEAGGVGKGGNIDINAANLSLTDGAQLLTITREASATRPAGRGDAGNVNVKVTGAVDIAGEKNGFPSQITSSVDTGTVGNGGNIFIDSGSFSLGDGAKLSASTFGQGNAGNVTVSAKNAVDLADAAILSTVEAGGVGNGGNIDINATSLSLTDGAQLQTVTDAFGQGNAGNVTVDAKNAVDLSSAYIFSTARSLGKGGNIDINAANLSLTDHAILATDAFGQGNGGNVTVDAKNAVALSSAYIFSTAGSLGKGGNIDINTANLSLTDGVILDTGTLGQGNAGNIGINAKDAVTVSGTKQGRGLYSSLLTFNTPTSTGKGGDITVNTNIFRVSDGALLDADSTNNQKGGDITVNANVFEALNGGQLTTTTLSNGRAGKITVNATDTVIISGIDPSYSDRIAKFPGNLINIGANSGLFVSSTGSGITGDIEINSPKITLDNQGKLNAESTSDNGGNINVNSDLLLLRDGAQISTSAGTAEKGGNGGNININSKFIVAVPKENSDINANAFTGSGGRVDITTNGIFGILPQKSPTKNSDITASSQLGVSGQVTINSPNTDLSRGLIQLPSNLVDVSQQITQGCTPRRGQNASSFIATGRGGLPQSPNEPLQGRAVITGWVDLPTQATAKITNKLSTASMTKSSDPIVEAQGWIVDANGNIMLVAQSPQSFYIPSAMSCSQ
ncbi:beta strand repeat-containing protein, partial [Nostoc sp.]|uniref:beta strand repeat-containing protein n=1 Tax=Nostoc sp. TaxID=1180 RepID=UPI002FFBE7E4